MCSDYLPGLIFWDYFNQGSVDVRCLCPSRIGKYLRLNRLYLNENQDPYQRQITIKYKGHCIALDGKVVMVARLLHWNADLLCL